jgi:hypothetical protein
MQFCGIQKGFAAFEWAYFGQDEQFNGNRKLQWTGQEAVVGGFEGSINAE